MPCHPDRVRRHYKETVSDALFAARDEQMQVMREYFLGTKDRSMKTRHKVPAVQDTQTEPEPERGGATHAK